MANLINLGIFKMDNDSLYFADVSNPSTSYSIITLNYDMIFERAYDFIQNRLGQNYDGPVSKLNIDKLHGSVDGGIIVAPTYNKSSIYQVKEVWKSARKVLKEANYLRIMGYSLPASDNHVRYLLKSSIEDADNLRKIDVICQDRGGEVRRRYDEFLEPETYTFIKGDIEDYLTKVFELQIADFKRAKKVNPNDALIHYEYNSLERAHGQFKAERA